MSQVKCRVLFIDDHEDSSEMLTLLLSEEGYEVESAKSVAEALPMASSQHFDLYVLDKNLPDGSGLELCSKLMELTPGVPCIFYTGDVYELHRAEVMAAGANVYIAKPDLEGLIENIKKLLAEKECSTGS
ncbi:MAG TPA: response regulator [Pyrinomonadaceae bacterium]|nr:response regulator [Pyrinomonadaceae bacterium]